MPYPETQAILDNANALDAQLADAQAQAAQAQQAVGTLTDTRDFLTSMFDALGATVMRRLHLLPYVTDPNARPLQQWFQPGPMGNTNPKPTDPHGTWSMADANGVRTITVQPAGANNNFFFGLNLVQGASNARRFAQPITVEIPDEALPNCMAFETNLEHSLGGKRYNQGLQLLLGTDKEAGKLVSGVVRYFDIQGQQWHTLPNVPLPPLGTGKPVEIVNEAERDATGMHFIAVSINGTRYVVDKHTNAVQTPWNQYVQYGVQLDTQQSAKAYSARLLDVQAGWN